MNVLIACEESQRVCTEFRRLGHEAYSCDVQEPSGGHPEWHILGDVLEVLNPKLVSRKHGCVQITSGEIRFATMDGTEHCIDGRWDLIIAHPPCTYLSSATTRHLSLRCTPAEKVVDRMWKLAASAVFFMRFVLADCERICVENPSGFMSRLYRKPDQIAIFSRQDLLQLALDLDVPIPAIYGTIEKDADGNLYTTGAQRTGCSMCGFGIQKERVRPHRLYDRNPKEWDFWMNEIGFGHVLDWVGCKWQQPYIPGEKAWMSQKEMQEEIWNRKMGQMELMELMEEV